MSQSIFHHRMGVTVVLMLIMAKKEKFFVFMYYDILFLLCLVKLISYYNYINTDSGSICERRRNEQCENRVDIF